jgi:hypothetical protein
MPVPNISNWNSLSGVQRAEAVLSWCLEQGIYPGSIMDYQLDAAMTAWAESMREERVEMGEDYNVEPSPMDYVHQIRAIAAFLRSRI